MNTSMNNSLEKSTSEPSLQEQEEHTFVTSRQKRKRLAKTHSEEISDFREEMKNIITLWGENHQKQMDKLFPMISALNLSNSNIEKSITFLAEQNAEFQNKIESLEMDLKKRDEQILILEQKLEDTARQQKKTTIEMRNVPLEGKESKEDLIKLMANLAQNINSEFNKEDIRDIYKTKRKSSTKTVVVELTSTVIKDKLLHAAKKFNTGPNNKLSAKHLGFKKDPDVPIFISESLTQKASRLYFLARDLKRVKNYKYCWTAIGLVYLRKDDTSTIIQITNEAQVQSLMNMD